MIRTTPEEFTVPWPRSPHEPGEPERPEHPGTWAASVVQPLANVVSGGHEARLHRMTWAPPKWARGIHVAIHATDAPADVRWLSTYALAIDCPERELREPRGAIVGVARLADFEPLGPHGRRTLWQWTLAHAHRLEVPVPCVGHPGLFRLHPNVAARVFAQLPTGSPLA